jgi:predicted ATPase
MGGLALYFGNLIASRTHLEQSLELSTAQQPSIPTFAGGLHPTIVCRAWLARALLEMGSADQARQRSHEAVALAQQMEHTPSLGYAEYYAAMLTQQQWDIRGLQACAEALMTLADAQGFALRYEQGRILRGWALAMRGDPATGVAQIRQGLAAYQGTGPQVGRPSILALLAEAYGQAETPEEGLKVLTEALALVEATEERWWEAELNRLKGALLL